MTVTKGRKVMEASSMRNSSTDSGTNLIVNMPDRDRPSSKRASFLYALIMGLLCLCLIGLMVVLLIRVQLVQDTLFLHRKEIIQLKHEQELLKGIEGVGSSVKSGRLLANRLTRSTASPESNYKQYSRLSQTRITPRLLNLTGLPLASQAKEMIHVVGKGNSFSEIEPDEPIHHWKVNVQQGHILLDVGSHIVIKVPGLYFIYSQVQFLVRKKDDSTRSVVYSVMRNRDDSVLKSVVPLRNCVTTCTRYHASLVKLDVNDRLSVQVKQKIRIITREEVTYFGAFLLIPN